MPHDSDGHGLRILHLVGSDVDAGGILSVLRSLQTATHTRGVEHVVAVSRGYREERMPRLVYRRSHFLMAESPNHVMLLVRAVLAADEVRRLLKRERFDVVHAHSRGGLLVAAVLSTLGRRVLFTNHAHARRKWLYRWAADLPGMWTVLLTPSMARHYGLPSLSDERLRVISACFADEYLAAPLVERRYPGGEHRIRFVGVGTIAPNKKWDLFLHASRLLDARERAAVELDLWGPVGDRGESSRYQASLLHWSQQSDVCRTRLRGPVASGAPALREADWFVLPSTNESCSVALMEALALGVPAVAADSGGNRDIVKDGRTGYLFSPDSVADLTATLKNVVARRLLPAPPDVIRDSVRERSASVVADHYLEIYRALAA
jgi:glycosyltransferase involved in cell wall biosynthesis